MKLVQYIARLGYGSRREVTYLFDKRRVTHVDGRTLKEKDEATHDEILVDGEPLDPAPGVLLMLHKPLGYVCSSKDVSPLVYELLPERFRFRTPIIAPIGRLDLDTSGLLLLTDDGQINHRISSPRTHLPKTYDAQLASELRGDEAEIFASGSLMLEREVEPLLPARLEMIDAQTARVTLTEGRYLQVRRMFAAVGNHVVALHRSTIGPLELGNLQSGGWRVLTEDERASLTSPRVPKTASPTAL